MHTASRVSSLKLLIVSDTHDAPITPLRAYVDVVLHCGDITNDGGSKAHQRALDNLVTLNAELKIVIPGNHDIDLDTDFVDVYDEKSGASIEQNKEVTNARPPKRTKIEPDKLGAQAESIAHADNVERSRPQKNDSLEPRVAYSVWHSDTAYAANVHLLKEGTHAFTLKNGCSFKVFASPITPAHGLWAFQRPSNEDRFNASGTPPWAINTSSPASRIPADVDIVMSHGPPKYMLDDVGRGGSDGCEHLARAIAQSKPLVHASGHIHQGRRVQRVQWNTEEKKLTGATETTKKRRAIDMEEDGGLEYFKLPKEFIGENSARKAGFARVAKVSTSDRGEKTLFVNGAVGNEEGKLGNVPYLVEIAR